jgi:hypothetical protein
LGEVLDKNSEVRCELGEVFLKHTTDLPDSGKSSYPSACSIPEMVLGMLGLETPVATITTPHNIWEPSLVVSLEVAVSPLALCVPLLPPLLLWLDFDRVSANALPSLARALRNRPPFSTFAMFTTDVL